MKIFQKLLLIVCGICFVILAAVSQQPTPRTVIVQPIGGAGATGPQGPQGPPGSLNAITNQDVRPVILGNSLSITGNVSGALAIGGDAYNHVLVSAGYIGSGTNQNPLRNDHQVGFYSALRYASNNAGPDTFVSGFETAIGTEPGNYTVSNAVNVDIGAITKGAGSTITRTIGYTLYDESAGQYNANFAAFGDLFTTNWFLKYEGTRPTKLGGKLTVVGDTILGPEIYRSTNNSSLRFAGGSAFGTGAQFTLYGEAGPNALMAVMAGSPIYLSGPINVDSIITPLTAGFRVTDPFGPIFTTTTFTIKDGAPKLNLNNSGTTAGAMFHYESPAITYLDNYYQATTTGNPYGSIYFRTKPAGGSTLTTALIIDGYTGNVGVKNVIPAAALDVTGDIRASSNIAITAGQFVGNGAGITNVNSTIANSTVYAAGTAYTMTATDAALSFGTTSPVLALSAGTYLIQGNVGVKYNATTYTVANNIVLHFRRTNNTAADLPNSRATELPVLTTFTGGDVIALPPIIYTASSGDIITIFGALDATPTAGSVTATSAEIVAIRLQ
jgi:hypothetical protein